MKLVFTNRGWVCISLACCILMAGCDSRPQPVSTAKSGQQKYETPKSLQGRVTNDEGPVKVGVVKALSEAGQEMARTELNGTAQYMLDIPAGTALPLILTYYPQENAAEDQRMMAAVVHTGASKYDINQLSTRIAKQAKAMGGYTHKNLVQAAESTGTVPASNKTTAGFHGDPTTQYGGWH